MSFLGLSIRMLRTLAIRDLDQAEVRSARRGETAGVVAASKKNLARSRELLDRVHRDAVPES